MSEKDRIGSEEFWELPRRERTYAPPPPCDTTAAEVTAPTAEPKTERPAESPSPARGRRVSDYAPDRFAPRTGGRTGSAYSAPRERTAPEKVRVLEYSPEDSLVTKVAVDLVPTSFNYYERFAKNALKSHFLKGKEHPKVPYFSYIPQYAQLSREQAGYYLWFRDNARAGVYLDCDFSYVLLYIYEIINLPDIIAPADGVEALAALWVNYREKYVQLDKYMAEWVADFCLVNDTPLPRSVYPILPEIIVKASFKEFYISALMTSMGVSPKSPEDNSRALAEILIDTVSDYDVKTSKYASLFDGYEAHITAAVAHALRRIKESGDTVVSSGAKTMTVTRDAFSGSLCSMSTKKQIHAEFISFARSYPLRLAVTAMVKYAENKVRTVLRLKSRLSADLDARYKGYIDEYFAPMTAVCKAADNPVPEYEKQYDAIATPITADAAMEIERASWNTTMRLVEAEAEFERENAAPDAYTEEGAESLSSAPQENPSQKFLAPPFFKKVAEKALAGEFGKYCRENGLFPDSVAGEINEYATELIGDVVLEHDGTDYRVIPDYIGEVNEWINN